MKDKLQKSNWWIGIQCLGMPSYMVGTLGISDSVLSNVIIMNSTFKVIVVTKWSKFFDPPYNSITKVIDGCNFTEEQCNVHCSDNSWDVSCLDYAYAGNSAYNTKSDSSGSCFLQMSELQYFYHKRNTAKLMPASSL